MIYRTADIFRAPLIALAAALLIGSVGCSDEASRAWDTSEPDPAADPEPDAAADADADAGEEGCGQCDDGVACNGREICDPGASGADARGCVTVDVPQPPSTPPGPCSRWGACTDDAAGFEIVPAAAGTTCDDGITCTRADACDTDGQCRGTPVESCEALETTCPTTSPFPDTIDVPTAVFTDIEVTLDGAPIPEQGRPGSHVRIFLKAKDTGVYHTLMSWHYDVDGVLEAPRRTKRIVAGVYDVVYGKAVHLTADNPELPLYPDDPWPEGLVTLEEGRVVGVGEHAIRLDVETVAPELTLTLEGQPIPTALGEAGQHAGDILASQPGHPYHMRLASLTSHEDGLSVTALASRIVVGTYAIAFAAERATTSTLPENFGVVARGVRFAAGEAAHAIDVQRGRVTATLTVDGRPIDEVIGGNGAQDVGLSLVREDAPWLRIPLARWSDGQLAPWGATGVVVLPGIYDVVYDGREPADADATGALPVGERIVADGVEIGAGSRVLNIDVARAWVDLNVTLDGAPFPSTWTGTLEPGEAPTPGAIVALDRASGHRQTLASWTYEGVGRLDPPRIILHERDAPLLAGEYDILYETDMELVNHRFTVAPSPVDATLPAASVALEAGRLLSPGQHAVDVDASFRPIAVDLTVDGQPWPETGAAYPHEVSGLRVVAVPEGWDVDHDLANWVMRDPSTYTFEYRTSTALPVGSYDLYVVVDTGSDRQLLSEELAEQLQRVRHRAGTVVHGEGTQTLAVDLPLREIAAPSILVDGVSPAEASGSEDDVANLYLIDVETGLSATIATWNVGSYGATGSGFLFRRHLVPGLYHLGYYAPHDRSSTPPFSIDGQRSLSAPHADVFHPAGDRILQRCIRIE